MLKVIKWLYNLMKYHAHLENYRHAKHYEPYDFSKDWK